MTAHDVCDCGECDGSGRTVRFTVTAAMEWVAAERGVSVEELAALWLEEYALLCEWWGSPV